MENLTKTDLFSYLDIYAFVGDFEVVGAVEDFFREKIYQDENYQASYGELLYFQELADEYIKERDLHFEKDGLEWDAEGIIDTYENRIEQFADYYSECY